MKKMNMSHKELVQYKNFAIEVAYNAGKILLKYSKHLDKLKVDHKKAKGIASNADIESEQYIIKKLSERYPTHQILGEESSYQKDIDPEKFIKQKPLTWVIDPLDGTNNFVNGFNYYSICIALTYYGKPLVGVVYRPGTKELYYAVKGGGAYYQSEIKKGQIQKIDKLKNNKKLCDTLCSTGFSSLRGNSIEEQTKIFLKLVEETRAIRRLGSAALDMCLVASGVLDCHWQTGLFPWDIAAAGLICEEANVKVTNRNGTSYTILDQFVLVARRPLFSKIKRFI